MRLDLEHFRTKLGRRIVVLFVVCAFLPTATLSIVSYLRVRSELERQSAEMMELGTTDAQMGALERLQSVESELILLSTSPGVDRALTGVGSGAGGTESLRRVNSLTLATPDGSIRADGMVEQPTLTGSTERVR